VRSQHSHTLHRQYLTASCRSCCDGALNGSGGQYWTAAYTHVFPVLAAAAVVLLMVLAVRVARLVLSLHSQLLHLINTNNNSSNTKSVLTVTYPILIEQWHP
jgi:hypothetical protein